MTARKNPLPPIDLNDERLRSIERQPRGNAEIVATLRALGRDGTEKDQSQLIAMSGNHDPFNIGKPIHVQMAEWFMGIWRKYNLRPGVHLRGIHYKHISQENPLKHNGLPYTNKERDWVYLAEAGKYARLLGYIGLTDLADQRNPDPQIFRTRQWDFSPETPELSYSTYGISEIIGLPIVEMEPFRAIIPSPHVSGYTYKDNYQPYHIEIWCEKSTMDDIIVPICQEYQINYWAGIGYQGISKIRDLLIRANGLGKPTIIFYISDLDRQGVSMLVQVSKWIEYWKDELAPDIAFKLVPLCLTLEQKERYNLPSMPLKTSGKKDGPKNITKFEEMYGNRQVELDALEALHPGELKRIILEAVLPYRDLELRSEFQDAYNEAREMVDEKWDERTRPIQDELALLEKEVNPIIADFQDRYQDLRDELAARLEPYNEQLNEKLYVISEIVDSLRNEINLPDTPKPETNPPPRDWLLDTDRGWLDQLAAYKRTHSGEIEDDST